MADHSNVVGEVASTLAEFTSRWVQSGTRDLDIIVASTIDHEWARIHKPVLSTREHHHVLYTKSQASQPEGKLVICHRNCGVLISSKARKETVVHTCTGCESKTSTPFIRPRLLVDGNSSRRHSPRSNIQQNGSFPAPLWTRAPINSQSPYSPSAGLTQQPPFQLLPPTPPLLPPKARVMTSPHKLARVD